MILLDKVAIVTGSSRGIGAAVALEFAKEGANVVVVGVTNVEGANEVARKIEETGRQALVVMADVSDRHQVDNMVKQGLQKFGNIDILVNNAGNIDLARFHEITDEIWDRTMDIHIKGAYNCTKAVVEHMIKQKSGKMINVTSPSAFQGGYGLSAYATAKGGIISFTRSLARELARYHINVNCVCPSAYTQMFDEFKKIPGFWERILEDHVLGVPKTEDIAPVFAFLASDGANYVTGQVIRADGGYLIGG